MDCAKFRRRAVQLGRALEARGRPFAQSSQAEISISQLEDPLTTEAFSSLIELPFQLRVAKDAPLSLTEARTLYNSSLLDTLCRILNRLQWRHFCNHVDDLASRGRGFTSAGNALACIHELLRSWHRVQPSSDAEVARLESSGKYKFLASNRSASQPELGQAHDWLLVAQDRERGPCRPADHTGAVRHNSGCSQDRLAGP